MINFRKGVERRGKTGKTYTRYFKGTHIKPYFLGWGYGYVSVIFKTMSYSIFHNK